MYDFKSFDDVAKPQPGMPIPPQKKDQYDFDSFDKIAKKKVGTDASSITNTLPSSSISDPVKEIIEPARKQYADAQGKYVQLLQNEKYHSEQQGMKSPVIASIKDANINQPSELVIAKQEHNKAANNLSTAHDAVQNSFFKNGNEAKKYLQKSAKTNTLDAGNETQMLASEKANELDKVYGDYQKSKSIAASAINEAMSQDSNLADQIKKLNGKLPTALEGQIISGYLARHKNDLEELSKKDRSIGSDYEDLRDNIEQRYLDFGMTVIANKLSKEREKQRYNSSIANFNTSTFRKHNDELASKLLTPQEQSLYKSHKEDVDKMIDTGGALNRLYEGAEGSVKGIANSVKDVAQLMSRTGPSLNDNFKEISDELNKQAMNVSSGESGWKKTFGDTFRMGGSLLPMMAGGELLEGAGFAPSVAGKLSTAATFGHDFMKEGDMKYPNDMLKAKLSGVLNTLAFTLLPDIAPAGKVKEVFKGIKPELDKVISDAGENVTSSELRNKLSDAFQKGLMQYGKGVGEMGGLAVFNQGLDKVLGMDDSTFNKYHPDTEVGDVMKQMAAANILPAGIVGAGELLRSNPEIKNEATTQPTEAIPDQPNVESTQPEEKIKFDEDGRSQPFYADNVPKEFGRIVVLKSKDGYTSAIETDRSGGDWSAVQSANIDVGKPGPAKYFESPQEALNYAKDVVSEKYDKLNTTSVEQPAEERKSTSVILPEENKKPEIVPLKKEGETIPEEKLGNEPPANTTPEVLQEEGSGNNVAVHHEGLTDLANKLGLKEPERGKYTSPEDYANRGRELLKAGADPNEVDNSDNKLHDRISIARAHLEDLVKSADDIAKTNPEGTDSEEYKKAWQGLNDYSQKVKGLGTEAHRAMTSLQGERDIDTDSFTTVKQNLEQSQGGKASKVQEQKIAELTDQNQKLKKQAEEAEAKLIEVTNKAVGVESTKKTNTEKAKSLANRLRKAKIHRPDSFSAATPASLVWDGAIETVAKSIEAGGIIADAVQAGLKHIKESDWYKGLSEDKKDKAEQDFTDWHNKETGLEDLQKMFLDKKGNKFSTEEAKSLWQYAKDTYLDNGVPYRDMITNVASDLGLTWKQVSEAITTPKVKPISDEMWKKMADYKRNQTATKNWIDSQTQNPALKALKKVSGVFRGVSVFGHGGIFVGTHAGMTLFQPSTWKRTIPAFFRGWKFAYGKTGNYERRMEQLKNDPNYVLAQRAGLKNNPERLNAEEYQKSQRYLGRLGLAGERGFNAIKVLRQDLFNFHYNKLSDAEKADPESAKSIAHLINNATGASNLNIPDWVNEVTFAGGMEAARWGKLTRNPAKATTTALKALFAPKSVTPSERVFAKVWARRVGEQLGTFAGILLANAAIQNTLNPKNPVNTTNPNAPDFLKFKFGDITLDPTSGMRSVLAFIYGIGKIPFENQKMLKGDTRMQAAGKATFGYGRGKLAPLYSTAADFYTQQDFNKNPLPFSPDKPTNGHHKLSWMELLWEHAPLPIAEAAGVMYKSAEDNGAGKNQLNVILNGIMSGAVSGSTGFRVGEYDAEKQKSKLSPFTENDYKDPVFKYFSKDWGMELPNTVASSEEITDEEKATKKKLSEYPKSVQDNYMKVHKDNLKQVLSDIKDNGSVYVTNYKDADGNPKNEVSLVRPDKGDFDEKELSKLSTAEKAQVLSLAQRQATGMTKKELFNQ